MSIYKISYSRNIQMGEVPNDIAIQLLNTAKTEAFIRDQYDEYCDFRFRQEQLLVKIQKANDGIEHDKKLLMILAWKWSSICEDTRHFEEIMNESYDFMYNGYILKSIEDEMKQTNVDSTVEEACRHHDYVRVILDRDPRDSRKCSRTNKLSEQNLNPNKFFLSEMIQEFFNDLQMHYSHLNQYTKDLAFFESRINELQRIIHPHLHDDYLQSERRRRERDYSP